jgi:hypothetical protein
VDRQGRELRHLPEVEVALDAVARGASASLSLDRASFAQLIACPPLCDPERIRVAVAQADRDDAAIRALARAKLGLSLPPDLVADVLVGIERIDVFLALARQLTGDAPQPLLDLLERGRLAGARVGIDQTIYTAFALWRMQRGRAAHVIVPRLRRLARRRRLSTRAAGLVGWLARQIGDADLQAVFDKHHGGVRDDLTESVGQVVLAVWNASIDEVVARLPERVPQHVPARW